MQMRTIRSSRTQKTLNVPASAVPHHLAAGWQLVDEAAGDQADQPAPAADSTAGADDQAPAPAASSVPAGGKKSGGSRTPSTKES